MPIQRTGAHALRAALLSRARRPCRHLRLPEPHARAMSEVRVHLNVYHGAPAVALRGVLSQFLKFIEFIGKVRVLLRACSCGRYARVRSAMATQVLLFFIELAIDLVCLSLWYAAAAGGGFEHTSASHVFPMYPCLHVSSALCACSTQKRLSFVVRLVSLVVPWRLPFSLFVVFGSDSRNDFRGRAVTMCLCSLCDIITVPLFVASLGAEHAALVRSCTSPTLHTVRPSLVSFGFIGLSPMNCVVRRACHSASSPRPFLASAAAVWRWPAYFSVYSRACDKGESDIQYNVTLRYKNALPLRTSALCRFCRWQSKQAHAFLASGRVLFGWCLVV